MPLGLPKPFLKRFCPPSFYIRKLGPALFSHFNNTTTPDLTLAKFNIIGYYAKNLDWRCEMSEQIILSGHIINIPGDSLLKTEMTLRSYLKYIYDELNYLRNHYPGILTNPDDFIFIIFREDYGYEEEVDLDFIIWPNFKKSLLIKKRA
jgi:hypothetical protein